MRFCTQRLVGVAVLIASTCASTACRDDEARTGDAADVRLEVPTPLDLALDDAPDGVAPGDCPTFITALADCPFELAGTDAAGCPVVACREEVCGDDADCAELGPSGQSCVMGNCVACWSDDQCAADRLCRGGRCVEPVDPEPAACPDAGTCDAEGCGLVTASELPCPICVCDSLFNLSCQVDVDCQIISRYPYRRCVYGRCAECASDADCAGAECVPPGVCNTMLTHPSALYGTWLIGWPGGLNHYSYFRFEPDGTLRRGRYDPEVAWADDIPPTPCDPGEWPPPAPMIGTWEPELTNSGFLVVRLSINVGCDDGAGWAGRYRVELAEDGASATFDDIDETFSYDAVRVPADQCLDDLSSCEPPSF